MVLFIQSPSATFEMFLRLHVRVPCYHQHAAIYLRLVVIAFYSPTATGARTDLVISDFGGHDDGLVLCCDLLILPGKRLGSRAMKKPVSSALYVLQLFVHTHLHVNTNICTYIHTYIHACIHTCMHTYIHTYTHTYINTYIRTLLYVFTHIC